MLDTSKLLTDRWEKLKHHHEQRRYWISLARFNVVPAGRRSGKTELAKRKLVKKAIKGTRFDDPRFFAGAPTRDQSKRIFWDDLKKLTPRWLIQETRESDLCIKLLTGSQIWVVGLDKPERIEGQPWDGGILDEYANMKESAFTANIRPALSDRQGWCDLIGVPEGRNHYYERYRYAMDNDDPEWQAFHWVSADILPASEIEAARRDLDEQTFDQEYNASFLYFRGRAYYPFNEHTHCARLGYDPQRPLILCFDFNVDPGVAAICQEQKLPNGLDGTGVIGEVYIPTNSNTPAVCQRIIQDWGKHEGYVLCYGDATGGNRGSAKTSGSDWDLIRMELRPVFGSRLKFNVPAANPPERSRINAVNTRLLSGDGKIRMMIDGAKAPYTVKDFEGTQLLDGGSGQIDKKKDLKLSHMCFAAGTMVKTSYGDMPIESMPESGFIKTIGNIWFPYKHCGKTIENSDLVKVVYSNGYEVFCTPNHMFLTEKGWVKAIDLTGLLCYNAISNCNRWKAFWTLLSLTKKPKNLMELFIGSIQAVGTLIEQRISQEDQRKGFIRMFGNIIIAKLQKVVYGISTIKMAISQTTRFQTLNYCLPANTWNITWQMKAEKSYHQNALLNSLNQKQRNGMQAKKGASGTGSMLLTIPLLCMRRLYKEIAKFAERSLKQAFCLKTEQSIVPGIANQQRDEHQVLIEKNAIASFAIKNLKLNQDGTSSLAVAENAERFCLSRMPLSGKQKSPRKYVQTAIKSLITAIQSRFVVQENAQKSESENRVLRIDQSDNADVYCISVPIAHCFALSNGVVVSNSDSCGYYIVKEFPITETQITSSQNRMA